MPSSSNTPTIILPPLDGAYSLGGKYLIGPHGIVLQFFRARAASQLGVTGSPPGGRT